MRSHLLAACALLAAPPALAQHLCEGNGHGKAYIEVGPAYIGGLFRVDLGSPHVPFGICFLSISGGFQESIHPVFGPVCLDVFSPFYDVIPLPTGPDGNVHLEVFLPGAPSWVGDPPFYAKATTLEGGHHLSGSKTVPVWFENPDSWHETGSMSVARILHTGTYLGVDGRDDRIRVLIAGGASGGTVTVPSSILASTEVFDPLSRTFSPGPSLLAPRAAHTATRLANGRVLIAGGMGAAGAGMSSAELFSLDTGTVTPTGSMHFTRIGHTATLLADGRVLVTGGFAQYEDPAGAWEAALDSAQATAELYDPATGAWTALAQPMSSPRAGHTATLLPDGRVLIAGGVREGGSGISPIGSGAIVPTFTATADVFDPATGGFVATADLQSGRAFHGASVLASGAVLITGGAATTGSSGEANAIADCRVWDGAEWLPAEPLSTPTAWHAQLALEDGTALVAGGLWAGAAVIPAIAYAALHDAVGPPAPATAIGLNVGLPGSTEVPVGAAAAVRMHDGALLLVGGALGGFLSLIPAVPTARAFVYTPPKP